MQADEKSAFVDEVARRNVLQTARKIVEQSVAIRNLVEQGRIAIVGAIYDVVSGKIDFLKDGTAITAEAGPGEIESANSNRSPELLARVPSSNRAPHPRCRPRRPARGRGVELAQQHQILEMLGCLQVPANAPSVPALYSCASM